MAGGACRLEDRRPAAAVDEFVDIALQDRAGRGEKAPARQVEQGRLQEIRAELAASLRLRAIGEGRGEHAHRREAGKGSESGQDLVRAIAR